MTKFSNGQRVEVPGIGEGAIINVRHDSLGRAIYTVQMDDRHVTPDGLCLARDEELRRVWEPRNGADTLGDYLDFPDDRRRDHTE